jgi:hypothetical protein
MSSTLCDLCETQTGAFYVGEGEYAPCFACLEATEDVRAILPLLYETDARGHLGAYGMKHDVEDVLGRYVSTEELVRAGQVSFITRNHHGRWRNQSKSDARGRTIGFYVKERFPLTWLWNKVTTRPKGAKTTEWDAYQAVLAEKERRASLPASPVKEPEA